MTAPDINDPRDLLQAIAPMVGQVPALALESDTLAAINRIAETDETAARTWAATLARSAKISDNAMRRALAEARRKSVDAQSLPKRIPISEAFDAPPPAPLYWIDKLVPERVVTLLGAHGGMGKTTLALLAAICLAAALEFMGLETRRARVAFYSAEDPREILLWRIATICGHLGVDVHDLEDRLILLDGTDCDPALFREVAEGGMRVGITTPAHDLLAALDADVFIIDNASDAYDAAENDRARVRAFVRSLAALVKKRGGAVLLLAHLDKTTARNGTGSEGYSGSTAWHNSVRSRLFLREEDGELVLEHQKSNFGKRAEPIRMQWSADGVPELVGPGASLAGLIASADRDAVVGLIAEFYRRGEYLSTSQNAPRNAYQVLKDDPAFPPRLDRAKFWRVLRDAERIGMIERETYRSSGRKDRERWAPAPSAPSVRQQQLIAPGASSAPSAPTPRVHTGVGAHSTAEGEP